MECGGKRSATPLWVTLASRESARKTRKRLGVRQSPAAFPSCSNGCPTVSFALTPRPSPSSGGERESSLGTGRLARALLRSFMVGGCKILLQKLFNEPLHVLSIA